MPQYDAHEIEARISRVYQPLFDLVKKLELTAEEVLTEFGNDNLDSDIISTFLADLSELENIYEEFITMVEEISQGLEYESRIAKNILESFRKAKELFGDIRIQAENLLGFVKPGLIKTKTNDILNDILTQLNDMIKKLRTIIGEEIRYKLEKLMDEQKRIEHLFPDEKSFEEAL